MWFNIYYCCLKNLDPDPYSEYGSGSRGPSNTRIEYGFGSETLILFVEQLHIVVILPSDPILVIILEARRNNLTCCGDYRVWPRCVRWPPNPGRLDAAYPSATLLPPAPVDSVRAWDAAASFRPPPGCREAAWRPSPVGPLAGPWWLASCAWPSGQVVCWPREQLLTVRYPLKDNEI